jgi:glycosyltransferase involved in cell wall biosynthesis
VTRVLLIQGAGERGGAERALLALARYLPEHGITPVVAFLDDGPFLDEVRAAGIDVERVAVNARMREPWRARRVVDAITSTAQRSGAELLHANGEKMAVFTAWAARRLGIACVSWLQDSPRRDMASTALQLMMKAGPSATYVTSSTWLARDFRARLGISADVVHYGVDLDGLPSDTVDPRPIAGWPAPTTVVAHFGRLQRWKGADVFLKAAALVAPHRPDVGFLVVGGALYGWESAYAQRLPVLAHELGIADRVHFTGHRDDAIALMAGCDVVVHSSVRPEPFGLVVAEGMAQGRAVIGSRTGGPEEAIRDGENGLLTAPGDPAALAHAITRLVDEPQTRARFGAAGRETVEHSWSARAMTAGFAAVYARLLATRASAGGPS